MRKKEREAGGEMGGRVGLRNREMRYGRERGKGEIYGWEGKEGKEGDIGERGER